jgi:hypothetical protein
MGLFTSVFESEILQQGVQLLGAHGLFKGGVSKARAAIRTPNHNYRSRVPCPDAMY